MERLNYFIRRFLLVIPTFIGITLLCFVLIQFVPGGPVEQMIMQMKGIGSGDAGHGAQAHGLAVEGRQRAGIAEADRADLRVGLGAGLRGAAAEHLRARLELDMDLESDGDLVVHGRSSARRPAVSQAAAMRNTRPSANAGPSTWSPTGRPAAVAPAGTETAQTPARLAGTV